MAGRARMPPGTRVSMTAGRSQQGPMAMSYMTREDIPYHYALADAFTVGDAYHCSIMGPTNPNRCYLWTGCVGNVNYLGSGRHRRHGRRAGHLQRPQRQQCVLRLGDVPGSAAGGRRELEDLPGPRRGNLLAGFRGRDGQFLRRQLHRQFDALLQPVRDGRSRARRCSTTRRRAREIINTIPSASAPEQAWRAWAESLFDDFRSDVKGGKLPQVSWIVAPAGYTEHSDYPINYGAWYISQVFDILVSNPEVFSKTVFIVNYDEADGSFDHIVPPSPPPTPGAGASTVSIENEIVTTSTPRTARSASARVCRSLRSRPGAREATSIPRSSITRRRSSSSRSVSESMRSNISPWRRAVAGDLTSVFNFANPNDAHASLPGTTGFLPSVAELGGRKRQHLPAHSEQRDHRRAGAGKRYPPGACFALRVGCSRIGQCFEQHGEPDVLQHRPRDCGVSGAFRQPRGSSALLHGGTRQEAGWYVERRLDRITCRFTAPMASCVTSTAASAPAPQFSMFAPAIDGEEDGGSIQWKITNVAAHKRRSQRTRCLYRQLEHAASQSQRDI